MDLTDHLAGIILLKDEWYQLIFSCQSVEVQVG